VFEAHERRLRFDLPLPDGDSTKGRRSLTTRCPPWPPSIGAEP
jgi:hypothetical protein